MHNQHDNQTVSQPASPQAKKEGNRKPDYHWLTEPVTGELLCGANLEFEPDFYQLEVAATPADDREYGDFVVAANDIDWSFVQQESSRLLSRTRDLRLLALWHRSIVALHGMGGLAAGFHVLASWLDNFWPSLHPELEEADSTARWLCIAGMSLSDGLLGVWRRSNLIDSRVLTISVKDFSSAANNRPGDGVPNIDQIQAFLRDNPDNASRTMQDVLAVRQAIIRIENAAGTHGTCDAALDLDPFKRLLDEIDYVFSPVLKTDDAGISAQEEPVLPDDQPHSEHTSRNRAASQAGCRSRNDAIQLIDMICSYYAQHEPSHPAPLFLRRAQRTMQMDFMEIMRELLPASLEQIETLAGSRSN